MSAPNAGRQSPEPGRQSEGQAGATTTNINNQGGAPENKNAQEASNDQKAGLSSNPEHPLEKSAQEKTSKQ
ncbi:hypothetical protein P280DRAFT_184634 [Massarina eburnea CBS 473.64]|uniref:Uncharacterized protein n=1 Tax=Massarina eburnea CBS 473.64 TaxID=1395130 RepID=A0A6A6SAV4_9PLEO|nr:hypothetical protein P280DRAFT_184634 [Massarina eburnea CBS 473.64]